MGVSYRTLVNVESQGQAYIAQSLTGTQTEAVLRESAQLEAAEASEDAAAAATAGLRVSAFVTACCLLDEEHKVVFGADRVQQVMDEVPVHLIQAVFEACMENAGLGKEDTSGN